VVKSMRMLFLMGLATMAECEMNDETVDNIEGIFLVIISRHLVHCQLPDDTNERKVLVRIMSYDRRHRAMKNIDVAYAMMSLLMAIPKVFQAQSIK
jgi:hypothetical protein